MHPAYLDLNDLGMALDLRWMHIPDKLVARLSDSLERVHREMGDLEAGAIANPDEGRQVGHYWLRAPERAPDPAIAAAIRQVQADIGRFVGALDRRFPDVLLVGIGGSALGPQLVADALSTPGDHRRVHFLDNTDPDGLARVLAGLDLSRTLVVVVSKSGGTPETRNGYLATRAAFQAADLDFARHAVAVTQEGSALDRDAVAGGWLARFPMWDWVGGRTSVLSAVGLLPAALQGLDTADLLAGARAMDEVTRSPDVAANPATLLALAWYQAGEGHGRRAMVVLPYKDRLALMARYLQQLVMESLGKATDRRGDTVHQGLTVYGNKGSTDQHAYVQQLREGPDDFFVTFIEVLEDGGGPVGSLEVEPQVTIGDYLSGFLAGTRRALADVGRSSITLTLDRVDAFRVGALIALYERAVGLYAGLIEINAYHQPGVEAGKKAAGAVLALQRTLLGRLAEGHRGTADALAADLKADPADVHHVLRHLAANGRITRTGHGLEAIYAA